MISEIAKAVESLLGEIERLSMKGELEEAERLLGTAKTTLRAACARVDGERAEVVWQQGDSEKALSILAEAQARYDDLGDAESVARLLSFRGDILVGLKRSTEAIKVYLEAGALAKAGRQLGAVGQVAEALDVLLSARNQYQQRGAWALLADVDDDIGEILLNSGRVSEAIPWVQRALDGYLSIGNTSMAEEERRILDRAFEIERGRGRETSGPDQAQQ